MNNLLKLPSVNLQSLAHLPTAPGALTIIKKVIPKVTNLLAPPAS